MKTKAILVKGVIILSAVALGVVIGRLSASAHFCTAYRASQTDAKDENDKQNESPKADDGNPEGIVRLSRQAIKEFGIEVGVAGAGELELNTVLSGEIVPNADSLAHIVPGVSGIVCQIKKKLGQSVRQGEILAVMQSRELAEARSVYLTALERRELAEATFTREQKLRQEKVSSEQDYLNAKQAFAEARIELRSAEQKLRVLGLSAAYIEKLPTSSDDSYSHYDIRAPFAGTVVGKNLTLGQVVNSESEIYEIADLNSVWVHLVVYQKDLALIRRGQQVVVKAEKIGCRATAKIDYISPIVDESTRTATARVVLQNSNGRWRPGIFVTGLVKIGDVAVDVLVPRGSLAVLDGSNVVFIRSLRGFEPLRVEVGRSDSNNIEILSGLKPGQMYVTENAFTIKAELLKSTFGESDDD